MSAVSTGQPGAPGTEGPARPHHLDGERVHGTVVDLQGRIDARFAGHGLSGVAADLVELVQRVDQQTEDTHRRIARTKVVARAAAAVVLLLALALLALGLRHGLAHSPGQVATWVTLVESTINNLVFVAIAVVFLWAFPERRERAGLLALLHQLRSLAHVVDMHQLTKEPGRFRPGYRPTAKSQPQWLTVDQMHDYLSYCTELLSLVGKTAALCAERSSDGTVLDTVSDVETLTTELSTQVAQKRALLHHLDP